MLDFKAVKRLFSDNNIFPLVGITLLVFFYLILVLSFDYVGFLNETESVIVQGDLDNRKMRLNSELMEIARTRTRITNQIIDVDDPFEQDEYNLELDILAGRFAALRQELLDLELNDVERQVLLVEHPEIVSIILPAQRKAVELAMSEDPADRLEARKILYQIVLPGQGRMVESLGEMIRLEQDRIGDLAMRAVANTKETREKSYIRIIMVISITLIISILVLIYVRKTQNALFESHQNLELTVLERTDELRGARDDLQRYVDLVDKYVITSNSDPHDVITNVSDAFCRISQYSKDELIGNTHSIVRHPDIPDSYYAKIWESLKNGQSWQGEIRNRAKDGSTYWEDVNIEPQYEKNGAITGYMTIRQDITDKKRIEELSVTDVLTQLFNRLKLDKTLISEIERSNRYQHPLSIILFDIDHFKNVNDTYGHQAGDQVSKEIAVILQSILRTTDIAGRWGGEEFLVICADTDLQGATELSERICAAIANHAFDRVGQVTSSFCVATHSQNGSEADILAHADTALYRAKEGGRNRVAVA